MNALLPLAIVAVAGTATVASAESFFSLQKIQPSTTLLHFDLVTSDGAGVVEVYDYNGHAMGRLLGSRPVLAGSNTDLKVKIQPPAPEQDAMAILVVGGEPVARQLIEFRDHRD